MTRLDHANVAATGSRRAAWLLSAGLATGYVMFGLAVHLGLFDAFDVAVRRLARPGGGWGPRQARASRVVSALAPIHVAVLVLLLLAAVCLVRRSPRPAAAAFLLGGPVVGIALGTKWIMRHSEARVPPVDHGGFPSGHVVSAVLGSGLAVLLLGRLARWWLLPAAAGALMAGALVFADVHPAADVLGGGVLAGAALTTATAAGLGPWSAGRGRGAWFMTDGVRGVRPRRWERAR